MEIAIDIIVSIVRKITLCVTLQQLSVTIAPYICV